MAVNDLTISQLATLANNVLGQAAGTITAANINDTMTTVAQTALKTNTTPVLNAITQVMTKTIFANRPYTGEFRSIIRSDEEYGNHVRMIEVADREFMTDDRYDLYDSNGDSKDRDVYAHRKPKVLQTNYYGQNVMAINYPVYGSQLNTGFRNAAELQGFLSAIETSQINQVRRSETELARLAIANAVTAAKLYAGNGGNAGQVINAVESFNILRGTNNATDAVMYDDIMADEDLTKAFYKHLSFILDNTARMMGAYSVKYVQTFGGVAISKQTTPERMRSIFLSEYYDAMKAYVKTDIHHPDYLNQMNGEIVAYWQSIEKPSWISNKPWYVALSDGEAKQSASNVVVNRLIGVLFDQDAVGVNVSHEKTMSTPWNAREDMAVIWTHINKRHYNKMNENFVAIIADDYTPPTT